MLGTHTQRINKLHSCCFNLLSLSIHDIQLLLSFSPSINHQPSRDLKLEIEMRLLVGVELVVSGFDLLHQLAITNIEHKAAYIPNILS